MPKRAKKPPFGEADTPMRIEPAPHPSMSVGTGVSKNGHRSVTVKVWGKGGIPKGDTLMLAFSNGPGHESVGAGGIITGHAPRCVSLPPAP